MIKHAANPVLGTGPDTGAARSTAQNRQITTDAEKYDHAIKSCIRCLVSPETSARSQDAAGKILPVLISRRIGLSEGQKPPKGRSWNPFALLGAVLSRDEDRDAQDTDRFHADLRTRTTYAREPGNPRFAAQSGRRRWRTFVFEWSIAGALLFAGSQVGMDSAVATLWILGLTGLLLAVAIRRLATNYTFSCHSVKRRVGLWPFTQVETVFLADCKIEPLDRSFSILLALVNSDGFVLRLADGRAWAIVGLCGRQKTLEIVAALETQIVADLNCMPHSRLLR